MADTRIPGRQKAQLPTSYYEGFLEKRSYKDKASHRFWTSLCGNTLFFFHSNKDNNYVEKLELAEFISVSDDLSYDRNLGAARFQLHLKDGNVQLTAPSLEARELWKGFICCVTELSVPTSLNLLPGQIHLLKEVVEKEMKRRKPLPSIPDPATATTVTPISPVYIVLLADMPACYQQVSRAEAEVLLDKHQDKGNLLLRQGRDGSSLAVSTRQEYNGEPLFKHYRVTRQPDGGFAIAVENPILCETLHDVISCLVKRTGGSLKPLVLEQPYENSITYVKSNAESGEKSMENVFSLPENPLPPVTPKPAFNTTNTESEKNRERTLSSPENPLPLVPPKPAPREAVFPTQTKLTEPEENLYLNDSDEETVAKPVAPPRTAPREAVFPTQTKLTEPEENLYLNDSDEETVAKPVAPPRTDEETVAKPVAPPRTLRPFIHQCSLPADIKISPEGKKVAILPPNWPKTPANPHSSSETPAARPKSFSATDFFPQCFTEELKLKVQKRSQNDQLTS